MIRRLDRLASDWPEDYMLASMGGTLVLLPAEDRFILDADGKEDLGARGGLDQDKVLWSTVQIPNTGGDW